MKPFFSILLPAVLLAGLLAGCAPAAAAPTASGPQPTLIVPSAGKGGLAGQVEQAAALWPDDELTVYAAPFTPVNDAGDEGFYVLEPNVHPHAPVEAGGYFQINEIEPGAYVLVVGPNPRESRLVINPQNKPQPFAIQAGEVLQAGKLVLAQ